MKQVGRFVFGFCLLAISAYSLPPFDLEGPPTDGEKILDVYSYFDVNNILMFVTNQGGLGGDRALHFYRYEGFYFPYSGNCDDNYYTGQTVVYSAGLFLGGKVNGEIRVAVGAYNTPEYYQGPADENGVHLPDDPRFKVYKIRRDSSIWLDPWKPECATLDSANHFNDWILWQNPLVVQDGAPLDSAGNPLLLGDETLWTVFNDGGPHNYVSYGGGTNPLGVEVHQTVWGYDADGEIGNVLFVKYKLYNKSPDVIDSFYISFWADPDLGGMTDDYVGCDTNYDMFFCYNADNDDTDYEIPPAWGGQIVYGPVVPSPGDTAIFDGRAIPDYKNIGMSSFNKYINGTDPDVPAQTYGYMQGFDAVAQCPTCPYIDPNTGDTTKFPLAGNPLTGTGWLDSNPGDRRLMVNMGPLTFNPGDSQCVVIKLGVGMEGDRLTSLNRLKFALDSTYWGEPVLVAADSVKTGIIADAGLRDVYFEGSPQWPAAVDWGGDFFNGGADYGWNFFGSYLNPAAMTDSFSSVEMIFNDNDPASGQRAYSYCRGCDPTFGFQGYLNVPFEVWDVDHDRQLNACFVEWIESTVYDGTWGPDNSDNGGREYLMILNSDYDGDDSSGAGSGTIDYTALNLINDIDYLDVLYAGWFRIQDGYSISDMDEGQKMVYEFSHGLNHDPDADSIMFGTANVGDTTYQELLITGYTMGLSGAVLEVSDPLQFYIEPENFIFSNGGYHVITLYFMPQARGYIEANLFVRDSLTEDLLASMRLVGEGFAEVYSGPVWHVAAEGNDIGGDGSESNPFATIQHAIDMSENGDTVLVYDGTYTGYGNRDISYDGRSIVVMSENGLEVTIIDCQGSEAEPHRGFYFLNNEDEDAILTGFTIRNGHAEHYGGAVSLDSNVSPVIRDCKFTDNFTTGSGGAIAGFYNNMNIVNCLFEGNTSGIGGAIYGFHASGNINGCTFTANHGGVGGAMELIRSQVDVENCVFESNTSSGQGGAIRSHYATTTITSCSFVENNCIIEGVGGAGGAIISFSSDILVSECLFVGNKASHGGGFYTHFGSRGANVVTNCTFYGNYAGDSGSAIYSYYDAFEPSDVDSTLRFDNCVIASNQGCMPVEIRDELGYAIPKFYCSDVFGNDVGDWVGIIADQADINGNFSDDPFFCDPVNGNFHIAENSLCAADNSPCGSLVGAYNIGCGPMGMAIEPDVMYGFWAYAVDSFAAEILLPVTDDGYSIYDIDTSTVQINGTIVPISQEFISSDPFGEYLQITILISEFVDGYNPLWDTTLQTFTVNWQYTDATSGEATGQVTMIGHTSGDANGDGVVNILDVTYLINYIYKTGPPPVPMEQAGDVNGDGQLNILDTTYLVAYLYKGGPPPIPPGF